MLQKFVNTVCFITACGISITAIVKHLKNYRKPLDQRLIVRILLMVPLFSLSAYLNLYTRWSWVAHFVEFVRELYEPFVIYTFYSLLMNLLGGEREVIFSTTGRPPVHFFRFKVDISDPHTFLIVKRLVMQYLWTRPTITLLMGLFSGHRGIHILLVVLYNISITLALNALMVFWVCLKTDLAPYRVVLKFLSVKMIVFFSYWQTLALSIIHSLGFISDESLLVWGNSLILIESVMFAVVHWFAFPSSDYNATFMFGFARLRIDAAFKDAFGTADLLHDFRMTFVESRYGHRDFDSVEALLDHPDSTTRKKRLAAGLRYRNGGRSKYWLPNSSLRRLLRDNGLESRPRHFEYGATSTSNSMPQDETSRVGSTELGLENEPDSHNTLNMEDEYSEEEETLYNTARTVYGDYNYPVATVQESEEYVSFEEQTRRQRILDSI